jgi:hypothetical protein
MSLTDALSHNWLASCAASGNGSSQTSGTAQYAMHRSLSDVSELSEIPEDYDNMGTNGDASLLCRAIVRGRARRGRTVNQLACGT